MYSSLATRLLTSLKALQRTAKLGAVALSDTELADRLLAQRLRASLFGAASEPVRIGVYRLESRLGAGGMGVVYRAHDPDLDRSVALKLVHPELVGSAERIRQEARALARLAHPNVVSVFDIGEHEGQLYVAMEYVEGVTLRAWLERVRLAPPPRWRRWLGVRGQLRAVLELFLQAARGLQAAHEAGLVHCDFKPENVLVGADGRVRVVDFGIASRIGGEGPSAGPGQLVGTPAYMAPEQLQRAPLDARADQFALCVALHEALSGERPFAGDTLETLVAAVLHGAPHPLPRWLPAPLRALVSRGLARDPERRFADMAAVVAELERLLRPRAAVYVAAAASVGFAVTAALVVTREPPASASASEAGEDLTMLAQRHFPALCFAGSAALDDDAYRQQAERLTRELLRAVPGTPEHVEVRTRQLALQLGRGDLGACKTIQMTLGADPPWRSAVELRCVLARHCGPADVTCPAGLAARGPGGCKPIARCSERGRVDQAAACTGGRGECCFGALALVRYEQARAGVEDSDGARAERRLLAEAGCEFGHAELCLEAAKLGADRARARACALGHRLACAPAP